MMRYDRFTERAQEAAQRAEVHAAVRRRVMLRIGRPERLRMLLAEALGQRIERP